jgi:hypothetical protein
VRAKQKPELAGVPSLFRPDLMDVEVVLHLKIFFGLRAESTVLILELDSSCLIERNESQQYIGVMQR